MLHGGWKMWRGDGLGALTLYALFFCLAVVQAVMDVVILGTVEASRLCRSMRNPACYSYRHFSLIYSVAEIEVGKSNKKTRWPRLHGLEIVEHRCLPSSG